MKRYLFFCSLVLTLLFPVIGEAASGVYAGPKIGFSNTKLSNNSINLDWNFGNSSINNGASVSLKDEKESGLSGGFFVGYNFETRLNVPIRVELDATFRMMGMDGRYVGDLDVGGGLVVPINGRYELGSAFSIMSNVWFDVPVGDFPVRPYIGCGFGTGMVTYDTDVTYGASPSSFQEERSGAAGSFAWMLGVGASYKLNQLVTLDLGYRYTQAKDIEIAIVDEYDAECNFKTSTNSHDVMLGARFTF